MEAIYMIGATLRKIVSIGLALCLMGTLLLSAPVTTQAAYGDITPFGIAPPVHGEED